MARHYCYALIDPRELGCPFYIGKGQSDRRFQHFKAAYPVDKRKNPEKMAVITAIEDEGLKPQAIVLEWYESEDDAYAGEKAYIEKYGIDNLTNKNIGGAGGKSKAAPKTEKKKTGTTGSGWEYSINEESFCINIAGAKFNSISDAYRDAYPRCKASLKSVNEKASRLLAKDKVRARIDVLKAPVIEKAQYTLEGQLGKFQAAYDLADRTDQPSAMTGAIDKQTKLLGIYPADKVDHTMDATVTEMTPTERAARIAALLEKAAGNA